MARYWVGGTGNWSDDDNHWSTSSGGSPADGNLPTSSDDVFIDSNSGFGSGGTITLDQNSYFNDFNSISGHNYTISNLSGTLNCYGSLLFEDGILLSGGVSINFFPSASETITTNSVQIDGHIAFEESGTIILQDDLSCVGGFFMEGFNGTFDANDHNVTANYFYFYADTDYTPTVIMGSGTWEATGQSGWVIDEYSGEVVIVTCETSTIKITNTGNAGAMNGFYGASKTYNKVWVAGDYTFLIGSSTISELKINAGLHCIFEAGQTISVTTFSALGTLGNLITLNTHTGSDQFTFSKSSGTVSCDYLDISNSNATGGATWYAGSHSADTANNDGWIFTDAPVVTTTQTSGRNSINGINSLTSLCALG